MFPKKLQKEKASIFNYKYSGTNIIYTTQNYDNSAQINLDSRNIKTKEIKYENKNIDVDESNNSNNNENTSSNKDEKRFCSSLESQGNTINSSNGKKKEELKENKFNISKYLYCCKKGDNFDKSENIPNLPKKRKHRKEKNKHNYEKLTTTSIFQSMDNTNTKNNTNDNNNILNLHLKQTEKNESKNPIINFENKLTNNNTNNNYNLKQSSININTNLINNNNNLSNNSNEKAKKQTFNIVNNYTNNRVYKNIEQGCHPGFKGYHGLTFKSKSCEKYSGAGQFNTCRLFKTITSDRKKKIYA